MDTNGLRVNKSSLISYMLEKDLHSSVLTSMALKTAPYAKFVYLSFKVEFYAVVLATRNLNLPSTFDGNLLDRASSR